MSKETPTLIRGGRALAAALAGAELFIGRRPVASAEREYQLARFVRAFNREATSELALSFGVRSTEARALLGKMRVLELGMKP